MTRPLARADIVAAARSWIGTPYHHQASLKGVGCDCLGLLRGVWRELLGREPEAVPPYTPAWAELTGRDSLAEAAFRHLVPVDGEAGAGEAGTAGAGDVLLFRWRAHLPAKHCAVLSGDGTMIHAHDGAAVTEVPLSPWWLRHAVGRFRFPGVAA